MGHRIVWGFIYRDIYYCFYVNSHLYTEVEALQKLVSQFDLMKPEKIKEFLAGMCKADSADDLPSRGDGFLAIDIAYALIEGIYYWSPDDDSFFDASYFYIFDMDKNYLWIDDDVIIPFRNLTPIPLMREDVLKKEINSGTLAEFCRTAGDSL